MEVFQAIGIMSGTSLDGVDLAACEFARNNGKWSFTIKAAHTYPYSTEWAEKLSTLHQKDALTFARVHTDYGHLLGELAKTFIHAASFPADIVASHGHTIFHQPDHGLTVQIGSGSALAAETGLPVICDFRSADVAMGGQGAPLVPVGDRLLFPAFDACINLGGFANISMEHNGHRIAYDICPVNIILNRLSSNLGSPYDKDGLFAASGKVDQHLLDLLNKMDYYNQLHPKSLGREWAEKEFLPRLEACSGSTQDILRTVCEHIAMQIHRSLAIPGKLNVLLTGGGAHNKFLVGLIRNKTGHNFVVPDRQIIDYKEAMIFAFLGVLRWKNEINVFRSVTGSRADHSGGCIWQPTLPPLP